jgi:hypothetical protein
LEVGSEVSVDASVTRATVEDELHEMRDYARTCRLGIVPRPDMLVVVVTLFAHDGEPFIMEISLDDYKEKPPLFEFIDPETGERGTRRAYPKTNDSLFHDNGPCICAPFNRKAYKEFAETGPHTDWKLGDWIR